MKNIDCSNRYNSLSCVFQEPSRFNTFTIAEADNVFLGDVERERDENQIGEALEFAGFDGADKDSILGKDISGTELSGGQWQKIAITRALFRKNARVYILDEPTAALDPIAEANIYRNFTSLTGDKTTILISHRLGVTSVVDRILVFDKGKIVEDGNHNELIAKNGVYAKMYKAQAKWYQ